MYFLFFAVPVNVRLYVLFSTNIAVQAADASRGQTARATNYDVFTTSPSPAVSRASRRNSTAKGTVTSDACSHRLTLMSCDFVYDRADVAYQHASFSSVFDFFSCARF